MDEIYREMSERNQKLVSDPNFEFFYDPFLHEKVDNDFDQNRQCLAIYGNCVSIEKKEKKEKKGKNKSELTRFVDEMLDIFLDDDHICTCDEKNIKDIPLVPYIEKGTSVFIEGDERKNLFEVIERCQILLDRKNKKNDKNEKEEKEEKEEKDYGLGTLHTTIMQLVGFNPEHIKEFDLAQLKKINDVVAPFLCPDENSEPFVVTYKGVIVTPRAIVLKGYPNRDVNGIRETLRKEFSFCIKEPYQNDACHSTLFRFKSAVPRSQTTKIIELCKTYENTEFGAFSVPEFFIGLGTWKLNAHEIHNLFRVTDFHKKEKKEEKKEGEMIKIAHRANVFGPVPMLENTPGYIQVALDQGFNVEIDVWAVSDSLRKKEKKLYLGHDGPCGKEIDFEYLEQENMWCHAKSHETLRFLLEKDEERGKIHVFSHDKDECVLTSRRYIWSFPGKPIRGSICVMPEHAEKKKYSNKDYEKCRGICSDFVGYF